MTKKDILRDLVNLDNVALKNLGLTRDMYVVSYGAAMVLRDLKRETHDIDLVLTERGYKKLLEEGYEFEDYDNGKRTAKKCEVSDSIDFFYGGSMSPIIATEECCFWVQTMDSIMTEKIMRGRPKDLDDVNSILLRQSILLTNDKCEYK